MILSVVMILVLIPVSCNDIDNRTDIQRVSGPYQLTEVNEEKIPSDTINIFNKKGIVIRGFIDLLDDTSWKLELELSTAMVDTTIIETGNYLVIRTNPEEPCGNFLCQVEFHADALTFLGNQAGGTLIIVIDSVALTFSDIRI